MRVLVVTQYFWPENFRVNDLTAELVRRGHEVTVLTGLPNYPSGKFFSGYGCLGPYREDYSGARVVRVPMIPRGRGGRLNLVLNYVSFSAAASLSCLVRLDRRVDVIFVHEPSPITVGLPAIVAKWLTKAPIVFWVLDLWPESISATGAVRSKAVMSCVNRLVRFIYKHCDSLLVPSRAFIANLRDAGVAEKKIHYFPNWAESVYKEYVGSGAPAAPLPEGFRIIFAGNVGAAQDFPSILDAAEQLKSHFDIHWIILGDGRQLSWVRSQVDERGLGATVHILGQYPVETMPAYFARADAMLVTLRRDPIFSMTIPAKLQAYLSCGRPILGMLDGEGARLISDADAGLAVPAADSKGLAEAVMKLYKMDPSQRDQLGRNAMAYSRAYFSRDALLDRFERYLIDVVRKRGPDSSTAAVSTGQKEH